MSEETADQATSEPPAAALFGAPPPPLVAGTFAIYDDANGGFVIVADAGENVFRRHIPRAMVRLARRVFPGMAEAD